MSSRPRFLTRRRVVLGALVGLVVVGVPPVAVYVDARRELARERVRVEEEIAEERARLEKVRLPCLRGEPIDEPGRARIRALFVVDDEFEIAFKVRERERRFGEPLEAEAAAVLDMHRTRLDRLREALRCTRVTPPSFEMPSDSLATSYRALCNLLILDAYDRTAKGDTRGALEDCLDAARLGLAEAREGDGPSGPLDDVLIGKALAAFGLRAAGRIVASVATDTAMRQQVPRELDLLSAFEPRAIEVFEQHRMARRRELCFTANLTGVENTDLVDPDDRVAARGWLSRVPRTVSSTSSPGCRERVAGTAA